MSRIIYEKQDLSVNRFAGPGDIRMIQITIRDCFVQMSASVFLDMCVEMIQAFGESAQPSERIQITERILKGIGDRVFG